jgi:hypothetical protein
MSRNKQPRPKWHTECQRVCEEEKLTYTELSIRFNRSLSQIWIALMSDEQYVENQKKEALRRQKQRGLLLVGG